MLKSHSSIFSFDTLHTQPKLPRAAALAFVLVAAFELGVSRADWVYRAFPNSYVGNFLQLERKIAANDDRAQIVILGNSRTNGFLERRMEHELGLREGAVLTLATAGGDPFDWSLLQRRNHEHLRRARLLILCVDNWQFDTNHLLANQRFRHFAGVRDRLRVTLKWDVLVGGVCRTYEKQELFRGLAKQLVASVFAPEKSQHQWSRSAPRDGALSDQDTEPVEAAAARMYKNFTLAPVQRDYFLRGILQTAKQDGQQVLIVQVPLRDEFMREVRAKYARDYQTYKQFVSAVDSVPAMFFEEGSTCGLEETDFLDYGHLSGTGCGKFTGFFAEWLRRSQPQLLVGISKN